MKMFKRVLWVLLAVLVLVIAGYFVYTAVRV